MINLERILLVEPNYKNKYPPIGLMKLSTYFKNKGDFVEFHKGLLPEIEVRRFDKVLITTLFTFDFNMCVQTIRYYIAIVGINNVYVGGIAATIMPENFTKEIPGLNILKGQMISSRNLQYDDNVNIDLLDLDYDILWDINFEYPTADSYFIYTTRGCPRKCKFCAVKTLEPDFYDCNSIENQVKAVDSSFGIKKQLLIMDNNILYSRNFNITIDNIKALGFGSDNNKIKKNSNMRYYISSLVERIRIGKKYGNLLKRIENDFINLNFKRISIKDRPVLDIIIETIKNNVSSDIIDNLISNKDFIVDFFDRYNYHSIKRYADFNQGLDARLFTDKIAKKMAELAINPCRIAFDDLRYKTDYLKAMECSVKNGITRFSNYLLYNFEETPDDLWERMNLNIQFYKQHDDITLFSFPMKYAAIDQVDRAYVGKYWNKKYLRAMNVILNVTSGVVAKEEDFFLRAFGKNANEFKEILAMPDEFIRYRDFFENMGLSQLWRVKYSKLNSRENEEFIEVLSKIVDIPDIANEQKNKKIKDILVFYSIRKKNVIENVLYYTKLVNAVNQ